MFNNQLPFTNYQLPFTSNPLPITIYQLPITNYAKQSQFAGHSNERNYCFNKAL